MNIDLSFLKITRFLLIPIALLFQAHSGEAAFIPEHPMVNIIAFDPVHQEVFSFNHYPSGIIQKGLLPNKKKSRKQKKDTVLQKTKNSQIEPDSTETGEVSNPVKSYQQLKGILEEVDMVVGGWI